MPAIVPTHQESLRNTPMRLPYWHGVNVRDAVKYHDMSEELLPLVTMRLAGRDMIPGEVRSRELAEVIESFEEMLACVVADRHANVKKDDVLIGLSSLEGGSIRLGFRSAWATMVVAAYLSVAHAVSENKFNSLPGNSIKASNHSGCRCRGGWRPALRGPSC